MQPPRHPGVKAVKRASRGLGRLRNRDNPAKGAAERLPRGDTSPFGNIRLAIDEAAPPLTIGGMMHPDLIERLHATPWRGVLAVTGGGSAAIPRLLTVPGASATVLEAVVPYSEPSLAEWLGGAPARACDEVTARQMAMRAFGRSRHLAPDDNPRELFGVGCTASLASTRPKRGDHRAHIAVQTAGQTLALTLHFEKGRRSRSEEEEATAHAVVAALAHAAGVQTLDLDKTPPGIEARLECADAPEPWTELLLDRRPACALHGAPSPGDAPVCLFAGSFNPPHRGHAEIVRVAGERTGRPVVLELSIANVDKPPLDFIETRRRLEALDGQPVWLTKTPTFVEKAGLAPGVLFAVGADTIERVGQSRYYTCDAERDAAYDRLAKLGCRFLVFGRVIGDHFEGLDDLSLPPKLRALCEDVAESDFRVDVSSTELRSE